MQTLRSIFRALNLSTLITIAALGVASAETDDRVGNWIVDKEKCLITASYRNGQSLIVQVQDQKRYALYLRSTHWELSEHYSETILYWANKENPLRAVARFLDSQTVRISVSDPSWVENSINHARSVSFVFGEKTYRIPITHGGRVTGWMEQCGGLGPIAGGGPAAQRQAGLSEKDEPIPGAPQWLNVRAKQSSKSHFDTARASRARAMVEPRPSLSPVRGSQALEFMMNVLSASDFGGAKVDVASSTAPWPVKANAVWKSDKKNGAVRRYRQLTQDQMHIERRRVIQYDQNACKGRFSHTRLPFSDRRLTSLVTVCEMPERGVPMTNLYLTVQAANTESFLLMVNNGPLDIQSVWQSGLSFAAAALSAGMDWTEKPIDDG